MGASPSTGRPESARRLDWLFNDMGRGGRERGVVVQGRGGGGQEAGGVGLGQRPVVGHGLLDGGQPLDRTPRIGQAVGLVVQRHGEGGQGAWCGCARTWRGRAGRGGGRPGPASGSGSRPPRWGPAPRPDAQNRPGGWTGCSTTWGGGAGSVVWLCKDVAGAGGKGGGSAWASVR